MELVLGNLVNDYVALVSKVRDGGQLVTSRGMATRELTAVTLIFPDILEPLLPIGVGRKVNLELAALEALQLISGTDQSELVAVAAPQFADVLVNAADPGYGAYGPRIHSQLLDCMDLLETDPTTRQAVLSIWKPGDLTHVGDKPCTVFMQFLIRPNAWGNPAVELHTHMRSQDVWLGVPYDIFMFTQLQHTVASYLRLPVGRYVHHATSLHIYERNVKASLGLHSNSDTSGSRLADLPHGIVVPRTPSPEHPVDVATYLLEDTADASEYGVNPWYAARLASVRAKFDDARLPEPA